MTELRGYPVNVGGDMRNKVNVTSITLRLRAVVRTLSDTTKVLTALPSRSYFMRTCIDACATSNRPALRTG